MRLLPSPPGRPEIDDRRGFEGAVDHLGHEGRGRGVLPQRGWHPRRRSRLRSASLSALGFTYQHARPSDGEHPEARMARSARGGWLALEAGQVDDARLVPARGNEAQYIGGGDCGGAIIRQRVVVERVVIEHRGIEHRGDEMLNIVDEGKGCHAAGAHPEDLVEVGGAAERKARRAQPRSKLFEVDALLLEQDREPEAALLVFQKEALAVTPGRLPRNAVASATVKTGGWE